MTTRPFRNPDFAHRERGRLTRAQRAEIARRHAAGERTIDLAAEYGIKAGSVRRIVDVHVEPVERDSAPFAWLAKQALYPGGLA